MMSLFIDLRNAKRTKFCSKIPLLFYLSSDDSDRKGGLMEMGLAGV